MDIWLVTGLRIGFVFVLLVAGAGCRGITGPTAGNGALIEFEDAIAAAQQASSYQVRVEIEARSEALEPLAGTYQVDVQPPDRSRTIEFANGREVKRTVVIEEDVYFSTDQGSSWRKDSLRPPPTPVDTYLDLLTHSCTVIGELPRFEVVVDSGAGSCDQGSSLDTLFVTVRSGQIRTIEHTLPNSQGGLTTIAHYQFDRPIEPIEAPSGT